MLVVLINFQDSLALDRDLTQRRYQGLYNYDGSSYRHGLSEGNNKASFNENALWLVCSLNNEGICDTLPMVKTNP